MSVTTCREAAEETEPDSLQWCRSPAQLAPSWEIFKSHLDVGPLLWAALLQQAV